MHVDDDQVGFRRRSMNELHRRLVIEQVIRRGVRGEVDEGNRERAFTHDTDLAGKAGLDDARSVQRLSRSKHPPHHRSRGCGCWPR